jgi:hypothetical protein
MFLLTYASTNSRKQACTPLYRVVVVTSRCDLGEV